MSARYCSKCGRGLDWPSEEVQGFAPDSGHHLHRYRRVCPNKRRPLDGHYKGPWELSTHSPDACDEQ